MRYFIAIMLLCGVCVLANEGPNPASLGWSIYPLAGGASGERINNGRAARWQDWTGPFNTTATLSNGCYAAKSYVFDGNNDFILVTETGGAGVDVWDWNGTSTVSFWIKHSSYPSTTGGMYYLGKESGNVVANKGWAFLYDNRVTQVYTNSVEFNMWTTAGSPQYRQEYKNGLYTDSSWHHVVWCYDRPSNDMKLWVDGVLQSTTILYTGGGNNDSNNNAIPLKIGHYDGSSAGFWFHGEIYEIRAWTGWIPTDAEVKFLYENLKPTTP